MREPKITPTILDTNVVVALLACSGSEGPDNNSTLDTETRNKGIDSRKLRGALINQLLESPLIIPEVVVKELTRGTVQRNLSPRNKKNLNELLEVIKLHTQKIIALPSEPKRQLSALFAIRTQANKHIKRLTETLDPTKFEIPENWEKLNLHKPPNNLSEKEKAAVAKIRENPDCLLWNKISDYLNDAIILRNLEGESTFQREALKEAQKIRTQSLSLKITPEEQERLSVESEELEIQAEEQKPFLIPDFEIAFIAERFGGEILTLDRDFETISDRIDKPKFGVRKPNKIGQDADIKSLLQKIRENLKKFKEVTKKPFPGNELF